MKLLPELKLIRWTLILAILAIAFNASAAPLILNNLSCYDLSGYMEILSDPTNNLTVKQVADHQNWTATVPGKVPNLGLTRSTVWLRFFLANRIDMPQKVYVALEYPVISSVIFYTQDAQGIFREEQTGKNTPASARIIPDRHFLFPLMLEPGKTAVVYLRLQSTSCMTLPVRILTDQALSRKSIRDYTTYGALLGLLVLVMLYFITVGSFLYKGTPIWLVLYSFFFGLHVAIRGGFIRLLLPDTMLEITGHLQLVAIAGLFFTGAKFFRLFLSLKKQSRLLDRIMMFFQYLSLTFIIAPALPNPLMIAVTLILIVINPLFSISLAFYFWHKGTSNAGFFAIGWVIAHLVSFYDFFRIHGALPYEPLGEWPLPFSLFIALIFLSAALIRQNAVDHLMAKTDPLTKLANRRTMDEMLHQEWDRCRRLQSPLSVIMADVDHFKRYNDTFGHRAGDQCLCRIAGVLANNTRRSGDLAARYGGEEFFLLLPHIDTGKAFALAERIRSAVERQEEGSTLRHPASNVTISLGVATTIPGECMHPEEIVMEADKAMYAAKRAGRNLTMVSKAAGGLKSY